MLDKKFHVVWKKTLCFLEIMAYVKLEVVKNRYASCFFLDKGAI